MLELLTSYEQPWKPQRLRVPRHDGMLFAKPSLAGAAEAARANHAGLSGCALDIQGRTLDYLRRWSREKAHAAAVEYTSALLGRDVPEPAAELFIAGGHQPSLFHPGVWVKNFAIGELAARLNGTALNLVVDNDTFSTTRIRVPRGSRRAPSVETIPFDEDRPAQPWEAAAVLDRGLFASFGDRVARSMEDWNISPLVHEMWPGAVERMNRAGTLADCLTAARSGLERQWGLKNIELPISRMCALEPFLWFASHIIAQLPRFRGIHNEVLLQYRQANKVRSRTHPVPDLKESDGFHEAPFWVWRDGDRRRSRLLAKQVQGEVWLSDGAEVFAKLPLKPDGEACCAVEVLRELPQRGIHLRTRALTTTLFTRLCLADLFVHGIGGSKYDEMTDRIIARFFRIPPPGFLTLSATLHLPLAEPFAVQPDDERQLLRTLRDLDYNSDRHLDRNSDPRVQALVAEKRQLIAQQRLTDEAANLTRRERRERRHENYRRFHQLRKLNGELTRFATRKRERVYSGLQRASEELAANSILQSREFSFCLYPAEKLQPFMNGLWERSNA